MRRVYFGVASLIAGIALLVYASSEPRECARHLYALTTTRTTNPCVAWTGSLSHSLATVLYFAGWVLVALSLVLLLSRFVQAPRPPAQADGTDGA